MELRVLQYFLAVAREQNISAAAHSLHLTQPTLSRQLRELEEDGLVCRKVYPEVPPRVEYRLTDSGGDLMPYLNSLVEWALKNTPAILERRAQAVRAK